MAAIVCPYTIMDEEALAWAVLLFGRVILLHPYPLPIPPFCREAVKRGYLDILTLPRTEEEIRKKDRILKEWERYAADVPGKDFLKYLAGSSLGEAVETQEEIAARLRGGEGFKPSEGADGADGSLLLCRIHEWMMQEWELETSLEEIEERERLLALSWQENPEADPLRPLDRSRRRKRGMEMISPLALEAWKGLKDRLADRPGPLITDQPWVWKERYGLEPAENRFISLPFLDLTRLGEFLARDGLKEDSLRQILNMPDKAFSDNDLQDRSESLRDVLSSLGSPDEGGYDLVLPPKPAGEEDPLILLYPALTVS